MEVKYLISEEFTFNPISRNTFGWQNLFFSSGIASIVIGTIYQIIVDSTPEESKFVSKSELLYIQDHRLESEPSSDAKIPYKQMLTSKPVWSVNVAFSTFSFIHVLFVTLMPKYLTDQLDVNLDMAGQLATIPTFVEFFTDLVATFVADWRLTKGTSVKVVRRDIMAVSQLIPGKG